MTRNADRNGSNRLAKHRNYAATARADRLSSQGGIYLIMFVSVLLLILGLCGLALDVSRVYNRKAELQSIADSAALAAARELNGTLTGVTNAETKASQVIAQLRYKYASTPVPWSSNALLFSSAAVNSPWLDATAAKASPAGLLFVRVDTAALDAELGRVDTILLRVVPDVPLSAALTARALAGRVSTNVTPLAVCAISNTPQEALAYPPPPATAVLQELVEFGFRRGANYDLMNLGSNGPQTAHFAVDAGDPLGNRDVMVNVSAAFLAPFTCSGTMLATNLVGKDIAVASPFPIDPLFKHLNTRFGVYTGTGCTSLKSPPDSNIMPHQATSTFNPLWVYAKAVPYSSYTATGGIEPAAGYTPFPATATTSSWLTLYPTQAPYPGTNPKVAYPATTPYLNTSDTTNFYQSAGPALAPSKQHRRVLNVPLLQCPLSTSGSVTGKVLGIGRFYMTVPATSTSVKVEFAGLMRDQNIDGEVELIRETIQ